MRNIFRWSLAMVNKIFIFDYLVKVDFFQLIDMDRKIFLFLPLPGMVLHLVLRNAASIRRILGGCWEAIGRLLGGYWEAVGRLS